MSTIQGVTAFLDPSTPITVDDRPHPSITDLRIVVMHVDEIALHLGSNGDEALVTVIDNLLEPLNELRSAALARLAEPVPA